MCSDEQSEPLPRPGVSVEDYSRNGPRVTRRRPQDRARKANEREWVRTYYPTGGIEPPLPNDPFERWLCEVEDACFQAGRYWERQERINGRPWWRFWDYAQRMSLRHAPNSRLRILLEPEAGPPEYEEVGYREQWQIRYPDQSGWDFLLRFLWLFARDSRLRRLIAPDK